MRPLALALTLAGSPADMQPVGLAWHDQATVDPQRQQRLIESIAAALEVDPAQVIPDAISATRQLVSYQVERQRVQKLTRLRDRLDEAVVRFRSGEMMPAWDEAAAVLDGLREDPLLPGASSLAWHAHLLRARVAWTQADHSTTDTELELAIALDPEARLSTRRVPPDFAARYEQLREQIVTEVSMWSRPRAELPEGAVVEIDGQPGLRALPAGEHFVVVRRLGVPPWASVVSADGVIEPPPAQPLLGPGLPADRAAAQTICERLELGSVVLAKQREDRVGLQSYACGRGFSEPWFSTPQPSADAIERGVAMVLGVSGSDGPARYEHARARVASKEPWPEPEPVVVARSQPTGPSDEPTQAAKPWYKRAWIWVLVGSVVVAGVTTGAVLGTRERERVYEVGPGFLR